MSAYLAGGGISFAWSFCLTIPSAITARAAVVVCLNLRPACFLRSRGELQTGLFVLVGLACESAILIVVFAREIETRGRSTGSSPSKRFGRAFARF